ncbi:RNase p and RNase mrp subunit [Ceratocystis lukuohia]|uniref:RNase p and RNase mrp subunit n=1 Tax=Ceratocystis lukuohia TaxID=2019550 RepID=A0ABR4MDR9_9PEZI
MQSQARKKTVYQLGTPFTTTEWPKVSPEHQDVILELLCSFLEPLGQYRMRHCEPSKGKSSRKRKRGAIKKANEKGLDAPTKSLEKPPPPVITEYVDVGLSGITRNLQILSFPKLQNAKETQADATPQQDQPYAAIFIARSGQPSMFHSHMPELVAAASRHPSAVKPIRLIAISQPCSERLTKALGLPRVSAIAIRTGAPHANALLDYVEEHTEGISSAWIDSATKYFKFQALNVVAVQTTIGQRKAHLVDGTTAKQTSATRS